MRKLLAAFLLVLALTSYTPSIISCQVGGPTQVPRSGNPESEGLG